MRESLASVRSESTSDAERHTIRESPHLGGKSGLCTDVMTKLLDESSPTESKQNRILPTVNSSPRVGHKLSVIIDLSDGPFVASFAAKLGFLTISAECGEDDKVENGLSAFGQQVLDTAASGTRYAAKGSSPIALSVPCPNWNLEPIFSALQKELMRSGTYSQASAQTTTVNKVDEAVRESNFEVHVCTVEPMFRGLERLWGDVHLCLTCQLLNLARDRGLISSSTRILPHRG